MARAVQGWFHPWPGDLRSQSCLRPVPVAWSSAERPGCGRWGPASPGLQLPQPSGSGHREGTGSTCSPLWALTLALAPSEHRGHGAERRHQLPRGVNLGCPQTCSHWEAWLCSASLWALERVLAVHPLRTLVGSWGTGGGAETSEWIMKRPPPWGGVCCLLLRAWPEDALPQARTSESPFGACSQWAGGTPLQNTHSGAWRR